MKINVDGVIFWIGIFILSFNYFDLVGLGLSLMLCGLMGVLFASK